jgi:hypothetical protein
LLAIFQWAYIGLVSYLFVMLISNHFNVDSWTSVINAHLNLNVSPNSLSSIALFALVVPSWLLTLQILLFAHYF